MLSELAPHLPPVLLSQALAAVQAIENKNAQFTALSRLAPHLPPELLPEALTAAQAIEANNARAKVLSD